MSSSCNIFCPPEQGDILHLIIFDLKLFDLTREFLWIYFDFTIDAFSISTVNA